MYTSAVSTWAIFIELAKLLAHLVGRPCLRTGPPHRELRGFGGLSLCLRWPGGAPGAVAWRRSWGLAMSNGSVAASSADEDLTVVGITIASAVAADLLLLVGVFACTVVWMSRRSRKLVNEHQRTLDNRVTTAIESTQKLKYPAAFLTAKKFIELGRLVSFERLRDKGYLTFRDTYAELVNTRHYIVFLSHQWLAFTEPDPDGEQYRVMVSAIERIAQELKGAADRDEALESMLVWVDYASIPQKTTDSHEAQALAVQTLSAYASCAAAFVVVAPEIHHSDTGELCNLSTYQGRMWCRAEQFCHILRNGVEHLWLATAEGRCEKMAPLLSAMRAIATAPEPHATLSPFGGGRLDTHGACSRSSLLRRVNTSFLNGIAHNDVSPGSRASVAGGGGERRSQKRGSVCGALLTGSGGGGSGGGSRGHGSIPHVPPASAFSRRTVSFSATNDDADLDWLDNILRVFQGRATREKDKFELVVPILGLYAELHAMVNANLGENDGGNPLLHRIYERIQANRELIFPPMPQVRPRWPAVLLIDSWPLSAAECLGLRLIA